MMNPFRRGLLTVLIGAMLANANAGFAGVKTLTMLDRGEPHEAMTFHDGLLWVGKSRTNFNSDFRLEVYGRDDQLKTKIQMPHSMNYMYPYGTHSVIVVGVGFTPNSISTYSVIEHNAGRFTVRTQNVPPQAWATRWIGNLGGRNFFTDPGGNSDDPARDRDFNLASQTFFSYGGSGAPRFLPVRMRLPQVGVKWGSGFYVIHEASLGNASSNVSWFDAAGNAATDLFASPRKDLKDITVIPGTSLLAASEAGAGQILLIDGQTQALKATVATGPWPRSLAPIGHCVVVGDQESREISVVDIKAEVPKVAFKIASGLTHEEFRSINRIAVDGQTGRIYARSSFPCNGAFEACDFDFNRVIAIDDEQILAACAH